MTSLLASATQAAHSAAATLLAKAQIKVGESLPAATVKENSPEESFSLNNIPGKIVLVGVPGAFTPACSSQVPGYLENATKFEEKGVKGIYVLAVNDAFVTKAWKEKLSGGKDTPVHFIADDKGEFASGVGLLFDASGLLGAPRSKRYVIVAEDGKVTHIAVEQVPSDVTVTKAEVILAQL